MALHHEAWIEQGFEPDPPRSKATDFEDLTSPASATELDPVVALTVPSDLGSLGVNTPGRVGYQIWEHGGPPCAGPPNRGGVRAVMPFSYVQGELAGLADGGTYRRRVKDNVTPTK
eukprot:1193630-Prorocentrum_minimum.AAC.6